MCPNENPQSDLIADYEDLSEGIYTDGPLRSRLEMQIICSLTSL